MRPLLRPGRPPSRHPRRRAALPAQPQPEPGSKCGAQHGSHAYTKERNFAPLATVSRCAVWRTVLPSLPVALRPWPKAMCGSFFSTYPANCLLPCSTYCEWGGAAMGCGAARADTPARSGDSVCHLLGPPRATRGVRPNASTRRGVWPPAGRAVNPDASLSLCAVGDSGAGARHA